MFVNIYAGTASRTAIVISSGGDGKVQFWKLPRSSRALFQAASVELSYDGIPTASADALCLMAWDTSVLAGTSCGHIAMLEAVGT